MHADSASSAAAAPRRLSSQTVLWVIAMLLAVIATALIVRSPQPFGMPMAMADSPMLGARGVFAFTGQLDKNKVGLFMMDVDNTTVWCYEYYPQTRKLQLAFARSFTFDRYLEAYNNDAQTSPESVREMLELQRLAKDRKRRGDAPADEGDDSLSTAIPGVPMSAEGAKVVRQK